MLKTERYKEEEEKEDLRSCMMTLRKRGEIETSKREH
jgi:hypothetical protein